MSVRQVKKALAITTVTGRGTTEDDPVREVQTFVDPETGNILAIHDSWEISRLRTAAEKAPK